MTDLEKQKVAVLRSQGQSYGAIADALHVSVNSVKTFCRRSHLSGSKPAESLPENNLTESENRVITTVTETPKPLVKAGVSPAHELKMQTEVMTMKRVVCLYRVSTVGQVDHDDIPMQRIACRDYAATHPDWEIVEEISEKGVSGYKVAASDRDAIVEIKKKAIKGEFDVLLVFMFDRLGRREDETPFVVQWFVQQGIEVWSTREGQQRFDTHVDKLLNYIRFWQASGESEKTSIRVRTKHLQMIEDGQYRGGYLPYGYKLVHKGRTNKKNQPVRDLVIDEDEAVIVREIFHLLIEEGYGTNRVANYLNERGIKTKRGTTLWRATSVRALIDNRIYLGYMRMGDTYSPKQERVGLPA